MKLAIVGSRNFEDYSLLCKILKKYENISEIVSGGARGADTLAEKYAHDNNIKMKVFKAEWNKWGKRAGPIRNKKIWEYADEGIAFWEPTCRGTKHSIEMANFFHKKCEIIKYKDLED